MTPLWTILVASVYARTDELARLLRNLRLQTLAYDGLVTVLVARDDCETPVGVKRTRLVKTATSDYVSFVDDDDSVSWYYVAKVMAALRTRPDYVGFKVIYSLDGIRQKPVLHTLTAGGWFENDEGYFRDLSHLNPIRRDAALAGLPFRDGFGEDGEWAAKVRASGLVKREEFVDWPLYHYDYSSTGSLFRSGPRRVGAEVPAPEMPRVEYL